MVPVHVSQSSLVPSKPEDQSQHPPTPTRASGNLEQAQQHPGPAVSEERPSRYISRLNAAQLGGSQVRMVPGIGRNENAHE